MWQGGVKPGCAVHRALTRLTVAGLLLGSGAAAAAPLHSGVWWDPSESGWGLLVTDQGDVLVPTWYAHDEDGQPSWFYAPVTPQADGSYRGTVVQFTGVPFAQISGQAADPAQEIGSATLRFADGQLDLDYELHGVSGTKHLQRFDFGGKDIACLGGEDAAQAAADNYSDLWFQPSASGWGLQVTHVDEDLYLTWYTYDEDRRPVYFNGGATRSAPGRFAGTLYRTRNGTPFLQVDGAPAAAGADPVGSFRLEFSDGASGTFHYTVGDVVQSWPVERIRFGNAAAVCSVTAWQAPGSSGGGGSGAADECLPPYRVGDLRRVRVTSTSGGTTDTLERDERVVGQGTFEDQPALVEEVSGETSAGTGVYARTFYAADGGDSVASFGAQSLHPGTGQVLAFSVNVPLRIEQPRHYDAGQTWEAAWTIRASAQGNTAELDASASWRYLGRESIATPAGTFEACKFETTSEIGGTVAGVTTVTTESGLAWSHPAWGVLRSESSGESIVDTPFGSTTTETTSVLELLAATRNGQSTP